MEALVHRARMAIKDRLDHQGNLEKQACQERLECVVKEGLGRKVLLDHKALPENLERLERKLKLIIEWFRIIYKISAFIQKNFAWKIFLKI